MIRQPREVQSHSPACFRFTTLLNQTFAIANRALMILRCRAALTYATFPYFMANALPILTLNAHVRRQPLQAPLAAESALFVAAERARRIELVVRVGPNDPGPELVHHVENLAPFVRPDARTQPVRNIVRAFEGFLWRPKRH